MIIDVLEDQFILGRRLPNTLKGLFFKPGFLTVEYVNGRVSRYTHPFRLYLVSSVIFFLLVSFLSTQALSRVSFGGERPSARMAGDSAAVAQIDSVLIAEDLPAETEASLRATREQITARMDSLRARRSSERGGQEPGTFNVDTAEVQIDADWIRKPVRQKLARLNGLPTREAVQSLLSDFLSYVPTLMFILLPVFAAVLKLLYIRRGRYYAEHFVFLLHVHSFVYLLLTGLLLLRERVAGWLELSLMAWLLVYIYLAIHRVYGQGWLKTFVKYWVLGWAYFWILDLAFPVAALATFILL